LDPGVTGVGRKSSEYDVLNSIREDVIFRYIFGIGIIELSILVSVNGENAGYERLQCRTTRGLQNNGIQRPNIRINVG
jgi:hypothetical protein